MIRALAFSMVLSLVSTLALAQPEFIRGDIDVDGQVDMGDVLYLLAQGKGPAVPPPPCPAATDVDNDGELQFLIDSLALISALYVPGAPAIAAPYPECGLDPENDPFDCFSYDCDAVPADPFDPSYTLRVESTDGVLGNTAEVRILLDNTSDESVFGLQWGVCHDDTALELVDVVAGDAFIESRSLPFLSFELHPGEGWIAGLVVSFYGVDPLDPGFDLEIARATYFLPTEGSHSIDFCDTIADPPVTTLLGIDLDGEKVVPATIMGSVDVAGGFLRGDANGDGVSPSLPDVLFILLYAYSGGPEPGCLDAADVDDDGIVNGVLDALFLLGSLFIPGEPLPPAPGGSQCGIDPTSDALDCGSFANCP